MTLFSIARKNIKNNFTNYFVYFASMIFSILIYFVFVSLKYDQTILASTGSSVKISSAFSSAAVVLMVFVAVFIWYSNGFFMRKRKKEVGLLSLLGVRKKQIGRMLFYENFIMGLLALLIGMALGSLLSKFFVVLLMKVMGYDAMNHFTISSAAILNTVIVFFVITLLTSIQGYRLIYRFQIIELFRADQEGEQEPKISYAIAILSVLLIGFGYWLALQNLLKSQVWAALGLMVTPLVILVTVILGTYLLFNSLTVALLKLSQRNKKKYWSGIRMIGISQLLYRIKGNARTLTMIAVLSATTLSAVGTAYGFYYNNRSTVEQANPNSMMFIAANKEVAGKVQSIIDKSGEHHVLYHLTVPAIQADMIKADQKDMNPDSGWSYTLISNRMFNQLASLQQRTDSLKLQANEAVLLDPVYMEGVSPQYVGSSFLLTKGKTKETVTFKEIKQYSVLNLSTAYSTIVISDEMFSRLEQQLTPDQLEAYKITHEDHAKQLTKEIESVLPDDAHFSSFYRNYASGMEGTGLLIFMSGFLGLVFLAATGSVIYFKQLTEANADKGRYLILHKIGVNKKEMKSTIAKQVLFVFALPLAAGVAHSTVALTALSKLLLTNLTIPVLICIGVYTFIYIAYYFLTVNAYYKIAVKANQ
ncbi:ABC transporter permease [Paenibacillus sp. OAS669]|uniref:ABC transporter permease n=1 Tax=Paenibacillus sp. OAS669 TaxID=2663821 RepID=UPI00178BDC8E|nr:ABC transporter permease [Paenibacillus sp. OAS669]MBE1442087.1 putative ABC transport system permease protein [Paenibacillus sp. OAS669]